MKNQAFEEFGNIHSIKRKLQQRFHIKLQQVERLSKSTHSRGSFANDSTNVAKTQRKRNICSNGNQQSEDHKSTFHFPFEMKESSKQLFQSVLPRYNKINKDSNATLMKSKVEIEDQEDKGKWGDC